MNTDNTDADTAQAPKLTGEIKAYSATAAALADLRTRYSKVVFDLTTIAGDRLARGARKELVSLRTALEAKRKQLKAPALEYSRRIDSEAARLTAEIVDLETPIDQQIRADEARRQQERDRLAAEETRRIGAHQRRIDEIRGMVPAMASASPAELEQAIKTLVALQVGAGFEEFRDQAEAAKTTALAQLRSLHTAAIAREAEANRVAEERAELKRLCAEQAAREKVERDRIAAEQRAENERLAAERERLARAQHELQEQQRAVEAKARQQAEREAAAQRAEEERRRAETEARRREFEAAEAAADRARTQAVARLHDAAQDMLDALVQWQCAEDTNDVAELANARRSRDMAIARARGEPIHAESRPQQESA